MTVWKFSFVLCSPNDCSSTKNASSKIAEKFKSIELLQGHAFSNVHYKYLARWEKLKPFLAFQVSQCSKFLRVYHISTTARQKVAIRGLTYKKFRVGTTCQGAILPAWQTELQRETLIHDWSNAKNNTSCNAGIISKLYAYCKSQNENSGLTAHEV